MRGVRGVRGACWLDDSVESIGVEAPGVSEEIGRSSLPASVCADAAHSRFLTKSHSLPLRLSSPSRPLEFVSAVTSPVSLLRFSRYSISLDLLGPGYIPGGIGGEDDAVVEAEDCVFVPAGGGGEGVGGPEGKAFA